MSLRLELMLALSYLKIRSAQGFSTAISTLGITLGVIVLIVVKSVMNGFHTELLNRIIGINGHIKVTGFTNSVDDYMQALRNVEEIVLRHDSTSSFVPIIEGQNIASHKNSFSAVIVHGIESLDLQNNDLVITNITSGDTQLFAQGEGILIGNALAAILGARVGDKINLNYRTKETHNTILGPIPRIQSFVISGIFKVGMYEYDKALIYMPLKSAQKLFGYTEDTVSRIEVKLHNPLKVAKIQEAIQEETAFYVTTWKDEQWHYLEALRTENRVMFIILTFIIIIASFNLVAGLNVIVNNNRRNIAILRTMGMTKMAIVRVFVMCGVCIGILGTTIGIALGAPIAYHIEQLYNFLEKLLNVEIVDLSTFIGGGGIPCIVEPYDIYRIAAVSLSLAFFATIYPSLRAARQEPALVLRGSD